MLAPLQLLVSLRIACMRSEAYCGEHLWQVQHNGFQAVTAHVVLHLFV